VIRRFGEGPVDPDCAWCSRMLSGAGRSVAQCLDGRTTILKIRYYNIRRDHFSWTADHFRIEAARQ